MPIYNKLVRDRIPEIIAASGRSCDIRTLSEDEFASTLFAKLVEEAEEAQVAASAEPANLPTEIADIYEVLDALIAHYGLDHSAILDLKRQRREDRGGFRDRI